jgi:hypothetical protein
LTAFHPSPLGFHEILFGSTTHRYLGCAMFQQLYNYAPTYSPTSTHHKNAFVFDTIQRDGRRSNTSHFGSGKISNLVMILLPFLKTNYSLRWLKCYWSTST